MARNLGIPYTDKQPYYFISYNSEDEARVAEYTGLLNAYNVPMWYDRGLKVGNLWEKEIAEKIGGCKAVIMFLSKGILEKESSYVHVEYSLAKELKKEIYVIMMDKVKINEIPSRFQIWWIKIKQLQYIDAFEYSSPEACIEDFAGSIGFRRKVAEPVTGGLTKQPTPKTDTGKQTQEPQKPYYFISYSAKDRERISQYTKELEKNNVSVWGNQGLEVGQFWEKEITEKVENCRAVIMFFSKNTLESTFVHKEFEMAVNHLKKAVYVVMLDDIKPADVPVTHKMWWHEVAKLQCVNAFAYKSAEQCVSKLMENIGVKPIEKVQTQGTTDGNKKIKRIEYKNGTYEGETVDGKRHGKGKYTWTDGEKYEGEYVNGKRTGKGKYYYANGNVYEGDWVEDERTGKGVFIWASGDRYEGEFVDGKFHGKGKYFYAGGNVYEGDWLNDKRTGKGVFIWADGDRYEGEFVEGKRTGKGKYYYSNGNVYEGDWVEDERTGKGVFIWASGDRYEGEFVKGKRDGKGKYFYANGNVYEGDWVGGERTGRGKFVWTNGDKYEGEFVENKLHGKGRYSWPSGDVYEGDYVADKRTGKGKYFYANGSVYEGDWVDDERTGRGKFVWTNGDKYEGEFANNSLHGKGKMAYANGNTYEGDWVDDERTGRGKYTYANGKVEEGVFENGVFKGKA